MAGYKERVAADLDRWISTEAVRAAPLAVRGEAGCEPEVLATQDDAGRRAEVDLDLGVDRFHSVRPRLSGSIRCWRAAAQARRAR